MHLVRLLTLIIVALSAAVVVAAEPELARVSPADCMPQVDDYTLMWWAYGFRGQSPEGAKTVCFRTGQFGMAFDMDRVRLTHLGRIGRLQSYADALTEPNEAVLNLPTASLELEVTHAGKRYRCTGGDFPSRIVESGRFFQRCDLLGLVFQDDDGEKLDVGGRLEIAVWPRRVSFMFEFTPGKQTKDAKPSIRLKCRNGEVTSGSSTADGKQRHWVAWSPAKTNMAQAPAFVRAENINKNNAPIRVAYDAALGGLRVDLPHDHFSTRKDFDYLHRTRLQLINPTDKPQIVRLILANGYSLQGIIGLSPMIRDSDGNPTGIPVQISKNWHEGRGKPIHEGPWYRGFTLLHLPPRSILECDYTMAFARWGGVPAASHAQLCLIGWGADQLWDEAAIGSWGESICFEPDQTQRGGAVLDTRPLMVWEMNKNEPVKWSWTNNVGGADFLVYYDADGRKQWNSRMKTMYTRYCPCLTEVTYAGRSPDKKIDLRYTVSLYRTDDITRGVYRFRYDVKEPVRFSRLVFFQCGGDDYSYTGERKFARGNETGLVEQWETKWGGGEYKTKPVECAGRVPWFSMHEAVSRDKSKSGAWANRGFVIRCWDARLGGRAAKPWAAERGAKVRSVDTSLIDILPPPDVKQLEPGDYVEAEVIHVVVPQKAADYYGPNENLRKALNHDENTWKMIYREAIGNDLEVTATRGRILRHYPIVCQVDADQTAEFAVTGGLGYVPITITALKTHDNWKLSRRDSNSDWQPVDQSIHGNDFWQTDYDPVTKTWQITYTVPLDTPGDKRRAVRFRFEKK